MPFLYDSTRMYTNQKCFILTGSSLHYLIAFFNSSIFKICYRESFPELQGGTRELSKIFFEEIYVPELSECEMENFIYMVQDVMNRSDYADIRIERALQLALNLSIEEQKYVDSYSIK